MFKKIKINLEGIKSENDSDLIKREVDLLKGVIDVDVKGTYVFIDFEEEMISEDKILNNLKDLGFKTGKIEEVPLVFQHTYFTKGTHCSSCEIIIEKKIIEIDNVKSVDASTDKVVLSYEGERPSLSLLNNLFKEEGYTFFEEPVSEKKKLSSKDLVNVFLVATVAILVFLGLSRLGLGSLVNITASSSLPLFFIFGIMAGLSSCLALVGGIVLSISKQWQENYSYKKTFIGRAEPIILFNLGRIVSFAFFGFFLGYLGSRLQFSIAFTSIFVIIISLAMIILALQMLGLNSYRFSLPRGAMNYIDTGMGKKKKNTPFFIGAATFFLPCGFTVTVQSLALLSGSPLQSSLMMLFFALGTAPTLFIIGLSSIKFASDKFIKIAGILVLFFAFYNINSQLNVLGFPSLGNASFRAIGGEPGFPPIINGKQVIKMDALAFGYKPNYFKVKVGIPVRWEIEDKGTSGCTNAIISRSLFDGEIKLTPGQTSIKEFTPEKPGRYIFSCWMGHISGVIEVVGPSSGEDSEIEYIPASSCNFLEEDYQCN